MNGVVVCLSVVWAGSGGDAGSLIWAEVKLALLHTILTGLLRVAICEVTYLYRRYHHLGTCHHCTGICCHHLGTCLTVPVPTAIIGIRYQYVPSLSVRAITVPVPNCHHLSICHHHTGTSAINWVPVYATAIPVSATIILVYAITVPVPTAITCRYMPSLYRYIPPTATIWVPVHAIIVPVPTAILWVYAATVRYLYLLP